MPKKILLYNPKSAFSKQRIPNSILSIAAAVEGRYDWVIVDGNCEHDPLKKIEDYLQTGQFGYLGFTVMPGPQLRQAVPFARILKQNYHGTTMIWGGYFPSTQPKAVLDSGYVDFIINGPGDYAFPALIDALELGTPYEFIRNLIYKAGHELVKTAKDDLPEQDQLPPLPYDRLDTFYPIRNYLGKTYLGNRTLAYHSSIGCPFTCSFCAVVPIYEARWKAKSAEQVYRDVTYIKEKWGADAIEFHDNNFFVSEKRTVAFARLVKHHQLSWWGMARIDTMDKYSDESLALIRESGCKIIFFGAESGNDKVLTQLDKGGTQTGEQIIRFAERLKKFDIIPEYSFVLGTPAPTPEEVEKQVDFEIDFIKRVKAVNPRTEIVIYTYSPVPTEGSTLYKEVLKLGFSFPKTLDDWVSPAWENFDMRRNPLTPWLRPETVDKIRNFETVLNGVFPTATDIRLNDLKRKTIRLLAGLRYRTSLYQYPYEIKLLQRFWKYRQPETAGF